MKESMPSCKKILDYWSNLDYHELCHMVGDKCVTNIMLCSDGEFCCWCCGKTGKSVNSFQRCHILGKQFGGSNELSNLFLMCEPCHTESPDLNNPKYFYKFVKEKELCWTIFFKEIYDLVMSRNILEHEIESAIEKVKQVPIGQHGGIVSKLTLYGAIDIALNEIENSR